MIPEVLTDHWPDEDTQLKYGLRNFQIKIQNFNTSNTASNQAHLKTPQQMAPHWF
jgi:hypothetical protein